MKLLLTGGTGYVGRSLRKKFREQGHDVRLLVREAAAGAHRIGENAGEAGFAGFDVVYGDILETQSCLRAADGCAAVVNLVGIIREFPGDGTTYETLHSVGTYNVVEAARRMGAERFVQMSALGTRPDAPSRYHRTKFEAEEIVRGSGMRWTIFRPSVIFHPGDQFMRELVDLVHKPFVPIIDGGGALLQPVSLENVTTAMAMSLRMPETQGRVFEIGGPDRISFSELVHQIAAHQQLRIKTIKVSSRFMRPAVAFLQRFRRFPLTVDQLAMLIEDNVCDPAEFMQTFGIKELDTFREALPALIEAAQRRAA